MQNKKNYNNNVHLHGFINDVRINPVNGDGRQAINLDIVTVENFQDKARKTYHDAVLFTDDKSIIKKFDKVAADCKKNAENRGVEGYKNLTHTVSLDGVFINPENKQPYILIMSDALKLDAKREENEVRNSATIVGNIGNIDIYPDKKFATLSVAGHYTPKEGQGEAQPNWVKVNVNGNRKVGGALYEAIEKGEVKKGDFVRVGGQLHNNNYGEGENKVYGMALDVSRFEKIEKKAEKTEKAEAKKKVETKKAETKKAAPAKKAAAAKAQPVKKAASLKR